MNRSVCSEIKVANDDFILENCLECSYQGASQIAERTHLAGITANVVTESFGTYSHRKFYLTLWASCVLREVRQAVLC